MAITWRERNIASRNCVGMRAAALPGQSLVVLDPELMLMIDVLPCEDGHAQERSLLEEILPMVQPGDLWIDDRNFCTTGFTFRHRSPAGVLPGPPARCDPPLGTGGQAEIAAGGSRRAGCMSRRCVCTIPKRARRWCPPHYRGIGQAHAGRRNGDSPADEPAGEGRRCPRQVARLYAKRWTIERAFQDLTVALVCEINTLGYPKAALFGFCLALVAYNAVSLVKASLRAIHGHEKVESEISWYYLCLHLSKVYAGMMIAIPAKHWEIFRRLDDKQMATLLKELAAKIDLRRFRKHPRGPKRPQPKKISGAKIKHVSTARILANRSP